MKKRIIGIAAAAVCSASVLAACGGNTGNNANNDKFVGHWDVKTMEAGGESLDIQALMNAAGKDSSSVGLDIQADGSFKLNIYDDDEAKGTWKTSGNDSIIMTVNGADQTAVLKDGKLTMSYGSGSDELMLYFEKDGGTTAETTAVESTTAQTTAASETSAENTETTAAQ